MKAERLPALCGARSTPDVVRSASSYLPWGEPQVPRWATNRDLDNGALDFLDAIIHDPFISGHTMCSYTLIQSLKTSSMPLLLPENCDSNIFECVVQYTAGFGRLGDGNLLKIDDVYRNSCTLLLPTGATSFSGEVLCRTRERISDAHSLLIQETSFQCMGNQYAPYQF